MGHSNNHNIVQIIYAHNTEYIQPKSVIIHDQLLVNSNRCYQWKQLMKPHNRNPIVTIHVCLSVSFSPRLLNQTNIPPVQDIAFYTTKVYIPGIPFYMGCNQPYLSKYTRNTFHSPSWPSNHTHTLTSKWLFDPHVRRFDITLRISLWHVCVFGLPLTEVCFAPKSLTKD